jgi:magnesium chelatase subunit I
MMIGEAERTRSIIHGVKTIPRFCDIHCIHQSSKFELSEMEDTRENRRNILDSVIESALKESSIEYVQKISPEQIAKIKNEFSKNKAFQVSQVLLGGKKADSDYESQLAKLPALKQAVGETLSLVKEEQKQIVDRARQLGIRTDAISVSQDLDGELTAAVAEVVLEGLRHIQPPVLDKKDNSYALAQ